MCCAEDLLLPDVPSPNSSSEANKNLPVSGSRGTKTRMGRPFFSVLVGRSSLSCILLALTPLSCSEDDGSSGGEFANPDGTGGAQPLTGTGGELISSGGDQTFGVGGGGVLVGSGGRVEGGGGTPGGAGGSVQATGGAADGVGGDIGTGGVTSTGGATQNPSEPSDALVGWASVSACGPNGTTGGGDSSPIEISGNGLKDALSGSDSKVIFFSGESGGFSVTASNKTVIGVNGAHVRGGFRLGSGSRNLIFKNIKFSGGEDAIEVSGGECIWFDHLEVFDAEDGNMDLVRGSDLITISWSKFYYVEKNHSHRLSNLNGNQASDTPGKINFTFHHNWWGDKVLQRMPRVRNGMVHVFNNYYTSDVAEYYIGLSDNARIVAENNFAEHDASDAPVKFFNTSGTEIVLSGNQFGSTNGEEHATGSAFNPSDYYDYSLETAEQARASVMAHAGVQ